MEPETSSQNIQSGSPQKSFWLRGAAPALIGLFGAQSFFSAAAPAAAADGGDFVYQYNIYKTAVFDFSKSYSADLGEILLLNKGGKTKKFRHYGQNPLGYLFNRRTGEITRISFVSHNAAPRKLDSVFWALLGSPSHHYPVPPGGQARLTAYLNLNFYPRPREIIKYVTENHKDLEYHIFSPMNFPPNTGKKSPPDALVSSIKIKK